MEEDKVSTTDDALSMALSRMKLNAFINVAFDGGGKWAVDFPPLDGVTLNVVQKGDCWLRTDGSSKDIRLRSGDCFLLMGGRPFTLATHLSMKTRLRAERLYGTAKDGVARCNGGGDFFVVGTIFRFEGHLTSIVFGRLPPVIHIPSDSDSAAIFRWSLERFGAELRGTGIGRSLMLNHLAPIMLLQALRIYLSSAVDDANWLVALCDPKLSRVIQAMQVEAKNDWSLEKFAALAGMSRSGFALAFKKKVGMPPMDYLLNWRMQVASDLLKAGTKSIAAIASDVGYGSEGAFSVAFKKIVKCRPGAYRRRFVVRSTEDD